MDTVPQAGKLSDHGSPIRWLSPVSRCRKETWHVFQDDISGSHLTDNSERFRPEVPLIISPSFGSCDAMGLTGESRRNEVNQSPKLLAVEGRYISPDRRIVQESVFDPCLEDFLRVSFPLDIHHRPYLYSCESQTQRETTVATEETKFGQHTHVIEPPL
jgi:hypothetical protein